MSTSLDLAPELSVASTHPASPLGGSQPELALSPRLHNRDLAPTRIEGRRWLDEEEDIDAAQADAEAEYAEVFAGDGRSRAKLLGEVCGVGDEVTCPELDAEDEGEETGAEQ